MKADDFRPTKEPTTAPVVQFIPVDQISDHPDNPRGKFDRESIKELAGSIERVELIHPIHLQQKGEAEFVIISGARRWAAVCRLNRKTIPAFVRKCTDDEALQLMVEENCHRQNLDDFGRMKAAELCLRLGEKRDKIASRIGMKTGGAVTNLLKCWAVIKKDRWWETAVKLDLISKDALRLLMQSFPKELGDTLPVEVPSVVAAMKARVKEFPDGLTKNQFASHLRTAVRAAGRVSEPESEGPVGPSSFRIDGVAEPIEFTGLQRRLLALLWTNPDRSATVEQIGSQLWPGTSSQEWPRRLRDLRYGVNQKLVPHDRRVEMARSSNMVQYARLDS